MHLRVLKIIFFIGSVCLATGYAATVHGRTGSGKAGAGELEETRIFPFNYDRIDVRYDLFLDLADSSVKTKYMPVFTAYHLPFTGEVWEAVLRQALDRIDRNVSRHVRMMPEEEGVYVGTGNKSVQQRFLRELLPVLSNTALLEKHLQRMDQNKLPE